MNYKPNKRRGWENIGDVMKDILPRVERLKEQSIMKISPNTTIPNLEPEEDDKCRHCGGEGVIPHERLVNVDGYEYPVPRYTLETCYCQTQVIAKRYNPTNGLNAQEKSRTFENSTIDGENEVAFRQCLNFTESIREHIQNGKWLYICGDDERARELGRSAFGTGKTHITHCIANRLSQMEIPALYITEANLYNEIRSSYNRHSDVAEEDILAKYERVPVLLIDDMFKTKITDWTEDKLFHLLDARMGPGKVTIINSNYRPSRIRDMLPKNGGAIESRIVGQAARVEMIGRDRRRK